MKDPNAKRPGYKKTEVGWIPREWIIAPLGSVALIQTGVAKGKDGIKDPIKLPYLRVANVQDGRVDLSEVKCIAVASSDVKRYSLQSNDVLFTEGGDFDKLGRGCVWDGQIQPCLHQNHVFAVRCDSSKLLPAVLALIASSPYGRRYFTLSSKQSTNLASINSTQLKAFPIPVPPLPEQRKISSILSTCDDAIERTRELIAAKREQKKGLMQLLLTGKRRLRGFEGKWIPRAIGELFKEVNRPVPWDDNEEYALLSVRRRSGGVFLRERLKGDQILTKVMFRAHVGDFLISRMQVLHGATGLVPEQLDGCHISGSYIALRPTASDEIDPAFFSRLSETPEFRHLTFLCSYGVHIEKMTFNLDWFLRSKVLVPGTINEQRAIAEVLTAADAEIGALERKLAALREQKRGLMQKLLTGAIRVGVGR